MTHPEEQPRIKPSQGRTPDPAVDYTTDMALAYRKNRLRIGLAMAFVGYLVFLLGARPSMFGLDRSPVVGFVQISVFLLGLAIISLGGFLTLCALWPKGKKTIAADIGSRLISTGYVVCFFTGMADIFGLGSHPLPNVFFGPLQAHGMVLGISTIAIGFLLLIRYPRFRLGEHRGENSSDPQPPMNSETPSQGQTGSDPLSIKLSTLFQ